MATAAPKLPRTLEKFVAAQVEQGTHRSRQAAIVAAVASEKQRAEQQEVIRGRGGRLAARKRPRRTYKTGRNQQINFKATAATIERYYRIADEKKLPLCEALELALNALERLPRVNTAAPRSRNPNAGGRRTR